MWPTPACGPRCRCGARRPRSSRWWPATDWPAGCCRPGTRAASTSSWRRCRPPARVRCWWSTTAAAATPRASGPWGGWADEGGRGAASWVGDLVVLEAAAAGLAGVVVWGLHRDTVDIRAIGLPVFSLGSIPTGPLSLGPRIDGGLAEAIVGPWRIGPSDLVAGDDDGVVFLPLDRADELFTLAEGIRDTERRQAERIRAGEPLREQVRFAEFLAARETDPGRTFRAHLRAVGGA